MNEELRVLQPMSLSDILDETLSLYRKNFVTFFGIALIPGIINAILTLLLIPEVSLTEAELRNFADQFTSEQLIDLFTRLGGLIFLGFLAGLFAYVALVRAVADRYLGREASIGSAFGFILPRFLPYLGTLLVYFLLFFGASLLVIIPIAGLIAMPVLYFMLWMMGAFINEAFVIEDQRYFTAFKRSRELAKANWGRIFLLFLIWIVIAIIVGQASGLLELSFYRDNTLLTVFVEQILNAMVLPILLTGLVLLYFDIRVRKEGFDLQLLAEELAARGGPPSEFPPRPENPVSGKGF